MPAYATLDALRTAVTAPRAAGMPPEWVAKMLHAVPDLPYVRDRSKYLVEKATGEIVLDLGCAGEMSPLIKAAARAYYGVDKTTLPPFAVQGAVLDLDDEPSRLPEYPAVTVVIAAEILEHLANPGRFLRALARGYPGRPAYFTVPQAGAYELRGGTHEMVNVDHVAWYSYTTLGTLLRRTGWVLDAARWYGGLPTKPEGLIALAHPAEPPA